MMSILTTRGTYSVSHIYVRAGNADEFALVRMFIVTCSSDLFIKIWDSENEWKNTKTLVGHEHSVSSVRFMPGDQFIVSASRDSTIRVFDVAST